MKRMNQAIASIVLTRYNEKNKEIFELFERLALQQRKELFEVIFYDQMKDKTVKKKLMKKYGHSMRIRYKFSEKVPLGQIRDKGLKESKTDFVIFTDLDVDPLSNWASTLIESALRHKCAGIVGGRIITQYQAKPLFIHNLSFVRVLYGELDADSDIGVAHGGSMLIKKEILGSQAYVNKKLGRQKGNLVGGEETDICERCKQIGKTVVFEPSSILYHKIDARRMRFAYLLKMIYYQGLTRGLRRTRPQPVKGKKRSYLDKLFIVFILPVYLTGFVRGLFRHGF